MLSTTEIVLGGEEGVKLLEKFILTDSFASEISSVVPAKLAVDRTLIE